MVPWLRVFFGGFFGIFDIYWIYRIGFFFGSIYFSIYLGVQLSRSGGILFFFPFFYFFLPLSVVDYLVCNTVYVAWG